MAESPRMIMAILLPFLHFTSCSDHTIHYVKPAANTPCPADPCLTLSEYAQQTHHYLTSNTTLLLLPGDHVLSVNFMVENVSNFEIYAQETSTADNYTAMIVCQGLVGFTFRYISHMRLHGLTLISCGKGEVETYDADHDYLTIYAVSVYLGLDINILNCWFQDSIGTALGVFYSSLVLKESNSFTNNCRGCSDSNYTCICLGGGIHTYTSTLIFEAENNTFTNNSAGDGGGIYAWQSTLIFSGNTTFRNNSAEIGGGGIWASYSSLKFTDNTTFQNNSAEQYGGGVVVWYGTLKFTGKTNFKSNKAGQRGGGILAKHSTLNFNCDTVFINNLAGKKGGGIGASESTLNFTGNTTFKQNSADSGGGIHIWNSALNFLGNTTFRNNSAKLIGGGICTFCSTLSFTGAHTTFTNISTNKSDRGIRVLDNSLKFTGDTTFQGNSAEQLGGGISASQSILNFSGNTIFGSNIAQQTGGGIESLKSTLKFTDNTIFRNNSAGKGEGIDMWNSTLNFTGSTTFKQNSADSGACGGMCIWKSTLNFTSNTTFRNNSAKQMGGGICTVYSTLSFTGNTTFTKNLARENGGGITAIHSTLKFTDNTIFRNNSAGEGGGIDVASSTLKSTGNTAFKENSADSNDGGAINTWNSILNFNGNTTLKKNSAKRMGGGMLTFYSTLNFTGSTTFRDNQALHGGGIYTSTCILNIAENSRDKITVKDSGRYNPFTFVSMENSALIHGGAVYTKDSILNFEGHNTFSDNSAWFYGGGVYSENSTLKFNGDTSFSSNSGKLQGGGMYGLAASIYFSGNSSFTANTAARGGGQYLVGSFNFLFHNTVVTMDSNNATEYGGAVYVVDSNPFSCFYNFVKCFFQVYGTVEFPHDSFLPTTAALTAPIRASLNIHSYFYNNHAGISGSAMYGGSIDNCIVHVTSMEGTLFDAPIDVLNMEMQQEPNSISSEPLQVCMCEDGTVNCNTREIIRQVHPGELLHFPVVATGQRGGVVPAVVRAFLTEKYGNASIPQFQGTQNVRTDCTNLYYQIRSSVVNKTGMLVLYADGPCSTDGKLLNISLQFLPCPPGFSLISSEMTCGCEPRLQRYTTRCNITERTLTREGEFWVGYDNYSQALILHPHCPFHYCKSATYGISFSLNNSDLQCETGRSGLLCGECKMGLSLALGSSKCIQCSNLYVLLVFPFALAGITLVLFLLICKLTVAAGTINGLVFYANVVTINHTIFFPPNQTNILTVFIAWLNLDLGIETCFFNRMDANVKTWLQFIFPLYIWSLVGLIITASYYSIRIGRLFGSNPVAVLATLFLLSYTKLLHTIIASLFFTLLHYPNDVQVAVWLHDGNIRYLHGKHIALFLVALLTLLILFLPYTLLLTVGQWLQAKSNRKCFHWINNSRIKPFLDAYHAPYRDQHRYWTGLLLCLRCALLLVFAFNTQADPSLNLLVIGTVVIGLLTLTHFTGFIYRKLYLDILEISFILNLGILAIATYYVKLAVVPVSQSAVIYTSVGIAFTTFIGVLLYHTYQQVWPKFQKKIKQLQHSEAMEMSNNNSSDDEADVYHEAQILTAPTMTVIECPNPEPVDLNDNTSTKAQHLSIVSSSNLFELREPLDLIDTNDP